jgi:hypothetical protein
MDRILKNALNIDRYEKPVPYEVPIESNEESSSTSSDTKSESNENKDN